MDEEGTIVYTCHLCSQTFLERLSFISHLSSHGECAGDEATTSLITHTVLIAECTVCGDDLLINPESSSENILCEACSNNEGVLEPQSEYLVPAEFFGQTSTDESLGTLHCSHCSQDLQGTDISSHACFQNLQLNSNFQENQSSEETEDSLTCRTCRAIFPSVEKIRAHWDVSGHPGQLLKNMKVVKQNFCISTPQSVDEEGPTKSVFTFQKSPKTSKEPEISLTCRTCKAGFPSLEKIRIHWELSGHPGELMKNTRVVKQNFSIKATLPGDKGAPKKPLLSVKEMFVKLKKGVKCENCEAEFPNQDELNDHKDKGCLTCITCKVTFLNILLLRKHYKYTSHSVLVNKTRTREEEPPSEKPPECPICKKTITSKFQLNKHLYLHYKGTGWWACYVCYMELDSVLELVKHVEETHGTKLYPCSYCDRTFFSESCHCQHESSHTREDPKEFKCEVCKLKFPNTVALTVHKDHAHKETKKSSCPICGKEIHNSIALRKHEKRHFYNKSLQCGLCLKTFRNKTALLQHNKTHNGMFKVECDVCSRGFMSVSELEEHSIVHNKKKYICSKCGVKCPSRNSYWIHLKMHDAPYRCDICQKTYRDLTILNCHRRRHWRIRPYICPHCPRTFSMSSTLRRHLTKHTKAYPHRCALCKKGFLTKYSYHKHLDRSHSARHSVEAQETEVTSTAPSLPFSVDEDLFQSSDTLQIPDEAVSLEEFCHVFSVTSDLMNSEVVFETSQSFEQLLH